MASQCNHAGRHPSSGRKFPRGRIALLQPLGQDEFRRVADVCPDAGLAVGGEEDRRDAAAGPGIGGRNLLPQLAAAGPGVEAIARASPSATCGAICRILRKGSDPESIVSRSVLPSMSCITITGAPSNRSISKTVTMLGWERDEAARAFRSNRFNRSPSATSSEGRTLIATSRPSRVSRPFHTSPIPPAPRRARTS